MAQNSVLFITAFDCLHFRSTKQDHFLSMKLLYKTIPKKLH